MLLALGLVLLAVGTALVATPLAIAAGNSGGSSPAPPPPQQQVPPQQASVNAEGVPLGALPSNAQQQQEELVDCRVQLPDRSGYSTAAAAAEARLLGGAGAAALPRAELQQAVGRLPPLLFGTVFWVLLSDGYPWVPEFEPAAAAQVGVLNAAFAGANLRFRLDAVVRAPVARLGGSASASSATAPQDSEDASGGDAVVEQCASRWAALAAQLLPAAGGGSNSSSSGSSEADPQAIHIIVCEPDGVNGAASVLGGGTWPPSEGKEDDRQPGTFAGRPGTSGTVLLRRGALWQSRTSLVHQVSCGWAGAV